MADRVRVGRYGPSTPSRAMARDSASWRAALAAAMSSSERCHERSVLTEPLAHELRSPNRDGVFCSALARPTRLGKHLGR